MPDWSLESLQYLSSEMAMADIAYFLGMMNKDYPERQTIVAGCSYAGALTGWFKNAYPQFADVAWASSGVV
jgi:predicted alpha/beta-fold hydrolase